MTETASATVEGAGWRARRLGRWAAWAGWAVCVLAAILGLLYGIAEQSTARQVIPQSILSYLAGSLIGVAYASVGLLLRLRRPDIVIGWLFMGLGLIAAAANFSWAYSLLGADTGRPAGPISTVELAWLANAAEAPLWLAIAIFLACVFPDGRPIGPRWRALLVAQVPLGIVLAVSLALLPGLLLFFGFVQNPHGVEGPVGMLAGLGVIVTFLAMAASGVAAVSSLVIRYRQGTSVEREQLKWFAWAAAVFVSAGLVEIVVASYISGAASPLADAAWLVFAVASVTVPVAAMVAILRYRLYDIDRVIGRTFVYGALTAILAGVYTASIRLFTSLFVGFTGQSSDIALVLTTLVLATTFTPIKQRLEGIAGRRFREPAPVADAAATGGSDAAAAISDDDRRMEEIARRVAREVLAEERALARGAAPEEKPQA